MALRSPSVNDDTVRVTQVYVVVDYTPVRSYSQAVIIG